MKHVCRSRVHCKTPALATPRLMADGLSAERVRAVAEAAATSAVRELLLQESDSKFKEAEDWEECAAGDTTSQPSKGYTAKPSINDPMPGDKDHVTKSWQPTLADMGIEHSDYVAKLKGDDADTGPIMMPKNIDSVQKWGDCVIRHGTKHADKTYRETYDENVSYRKWIMHNAKGDHMNDFKQYVRARNRLTKLLETSKKDAETANHERECDDVFEKK